MALQVWLPLTKDLRQQGLSNVTVTNNGATFNSAGKLGGCYSFDGTDDRIYANNVSINNSAMSACCWVKFNNLTSSDYPYIFALGSNTSGTGIQIGLAVWKSDSKIHLVGNGSEPSSGYTPPTNTWIHLCITINGATTKLYVNGVLTNTQTNANSPKTQTCLCLGARPNSTSGAGTAFSYPISGYINDFRLYDHCLSPMEVKELSKGLVLHYPLNDNKVQQMDNCYNYPRFENSASSGGWSHWGRTGASGSSGQSTDSNYIFRAGQTYAHWVANASGATGEYLLYQSPAFEGGSRSVQCICKEENGVTIDENIVFPAWNARSGGAPNNKWTSVTSLGNGFYLCKCEDIQQDGSNDLVGFYVCPGKKVYFSEAYLENDKEVCSNPFFQSNIVYDCSGFCNNGTITGTFTCSSDTPKYQVSTKITPNSNIQFTPMFAGANSWTVAAWIKPTVANNDGKAWFSIEQDTYWQVTCYSNQLGIRDNSIGGTGTRKNYSFGTVAANTWVHLVATYDKGTLKLYNNGVLQNTNTVGGTYLNSMNNGRWGSAVQDGYYWNGQISDARLYATALSADDVKSLYQNCATIDLDGTIRGQIRS